MVVKLSNIPNVISAATPKGLRRLMFKLNVRSSKRYIFNHIQFVNGKWYAWYEEDFRQENIREGKDPNAL